MKIVKNYYLLSILSISLCFLISIPSTLGFWGYGDCTNYHGLTYIKPYLEDNAVINLDGVPSESFWTEHSDSTKNGSLIIPLASKITETEFFIVYLDIVFVLSEEYLYILCSWEDNTTRPDLGGNYYDGLYFCWNINVPNFSAYFLGGMDTNEMGGGDVDCWDWRIMSSSPPNGTSNYCDDLCFGTYGWYDPFLESENVKVAYTYKANSSYTLEIERKLVTGEDYDVQINKSQLYLFNMGIMQDGTHEDHAISWTYALDLRNEEQTVIIFGSNPIIFTLIMILSIVTIIKCIWGKKKII